MLTILVRWVCITRRAPTAAEAPSPQVPKVPKVPKVHGTRHTARSGGPLPRRALQCRAQPKAEGGRGPYFYTTPSNKTKNNTNIHTALPLLCRARPSAARRADLQPVGLQLPSPRAEPSATRRAEPCSPPGCSAEPSA